MFKNSGRTFKITSDLSDMKTNSKNRKKLIILGKGI